MRTWQLIGNPRLNNLIINTATFSCVWLFFAYLVFSHDNITSVDGLYHIKLSEIMGRQGPFLGEFPWMSHAIFKEYWVDQQFLWHVMLIPFTAFDLITGTKLAAATLAAAACLAFYLFIKKQKVPFPHFWLLLLLAASPFFLYRMIMLRTQSTAILLMVIYIYFLLRNRHIPILITSFIFIWTYHIAILLIPITLVYLVVQLIYDRKLLFKPLFYCLGGIILGLTLNPFFPHTFDFLFFHVIFTAFNKFSAIAGNEWNALSSRHMLQVGMVGFVIFFGAIGLLLLKGVKIKKDTFFLFLLSLLTLAMFARTEKHVEYWAPFTMLFVAHAGRDLFAELSGDMFRHWLVKMVAGVAVALAGLAIVLHGRSVGGYIPRSGFSRDKFAGAAEWIEKNVPAGANLYNVKWEDFPYLFYHNNRHRSIVGLDPNYLLFHKPKLYLLYEAIFFGKAPNAAEIIHGKFNSRYVVTSRPFAGFLSLAQKDSRFVRVYDDGKVRIYGININRRPEAIE